VADWLSVLKTQMKEVTLPLARKFWPGVSPKDEPYFNYRYQHVEQVERNARKLLAAYGGDEDIVLASVWLHDRFQPQYEGEDHGKKGAAWAQENLAGFGFPAGKVREVAYCVASHSLKKYLGEIIPEGHPEAWIIWDADKLDKTGAVMPIYLLAGNPAFPATKVNFDWARRELRNWEKGDKHLIDDFYFPLSRELGRKRWAALKAFVDALDEQTGI
jgi:hypothetical protein